MEKTTLNFPDALAEVVTVDNIIYIRVSGIYTDAVAMELIRYLEPIIEQIPINPIRVWDASGIPTEGFKLSSECIDSIAQWGRKIKSKKTGSLAYMISPTWISYGMSRMYALKSGLESTGVIVIHNIDELPEEIRRRLPL